MDISDAILLDGPRITADGYLTAMVKVARTGIQLYSGASVGKPEMKVVRVYRPEAEVFSDATMRSFAHRPMTLEHPTQLVDAANWKQHAIGQVGGEVTRDGQTVVVPMVLMDAAAIAEVASGRRQLSCGYTCDLAWEPGKLADGSEYDAVQKNIRGNHIAVTMTARGGPQLKIGDEGEEPVLKKITYDGITIEVTDAGAEVIAKLQSTVADRDTKLGKLTADLATATTLVQTRDGEIVGLKKQLADAAITPAKLDEAVKARAIVVDAATRIVGEADKAKLITADRTDADIRKQAVTIKLGEATVKDMSEAAIEGAFKALTPAKLADGTTAAPVAGPAVVQPTAAATLARAIGDAKPGATVDSVRQAAEAAEANAWKPKTAAAA